MQRQARQAVTLDEQHPIQEKTSKLERRLAQRTAVETLFTMRWAVQ